MPGPVSVEEKKEIESIATGLSNASLSTGLQTLLNREVMLLEESDMGDGENREITLHNVALLVTATARIRDLADAEAEMIADALKEKVPV